MVGLVRIGNDTVLQYPCNKRRCKDSVALKQMRFKKQFPQMMLDDRCRRAIETRVLNAAFF